MRLRTFTARTMADAMRKLREELGDDAILVSTETGRGGVRLVAAVDEPADDPVFPGRANDDHAEHDPDSDDDDELH
ncbi:MAG TPA: hypothetical protein VNT30_00970, partial [Stellaceae bacterium]|nr:hypothetical protein [Stellaceae bacterium]